MKDRLVTFALAVVALALFYILLLRPEVPPPHATHPLSVERGPNGYYALQQWLAGQGIRVVSLRERFETLSNVTGHPAHGNLLLTTMPHRYPVRPTELDGLRKWIEAGNTMLVMAALTDTPDWSMEPGYESSAFIEHLKTVTGLDFKQIVPEPPTPKDAPKSGAKNDPKSGKGAEQKSLPQAVRKAASEAASDLAATLGSEERGLVPNADHPLLAGVKSGLAISEFPGTNWGAYENDARLVLELAHNPDTDHPVLWLARLGAGHVIVSAYGSLFTNKAIGRKDNARLLANIVSRMRAPQGAVLIDDAHQGVADFYDPKAFYADARLHNSLWWLLGLWLAFVLATLPLRAKFSRWTPVDITGFVRSTGGFLARVLKPGAAAQRLFANFFNEVRRRSGLPQNGAPVWDWLATQSVIPAGDVESLTAMHVQALRGEKVDLVTLHNLLATTQKNLL
jgi:hypothetical protein